jgi:hypothetical protein
LKEIQIVGGCGVLDNNGEELCECVNLSAANAIPGDEVGQLILILCFKSILNYFVFIILDLQRIKNFAYFSETKRINDMF